MTERELTRLLDEAVPPIPDELADAPFPSIRRRARQRRTVATAVACGAVAVAVGVVAVGVAMAPWRGVSAPSPAAAATTPAADPTTPAADPTTPATQPPVSSSVPEARVDRAGTGLTLYVNPDRTNCLSYQDLTPVIDERPDQVVVTFSGTGTKVECDLLRAAPIVATLAEPLGGRTLLDGSGAPIRPFFDADLPVLPVAWSPVPGGFVDLDGTTFTLAYQKIGAGLEAIFTASTGRPPYDPTYPTSGGPAVLGSRTGAFFGPNGGMAGVRWQVRDLTYEMLLMPNEGSSVTIDDLRVIINEFTWP